MRKTATALLLCMVLPMVSCSLRRHVPVHSDTRPVAGEMKGTWSGGVVDKFPHTVRGADLLQISIRGSHEAAAFTETVEYRSGGILYRAEISSRDTSGECILLRERVWEGSFLVKEWLRKICEGERYGPGTGKWNRTTQDVDFSGRAWRPALQTSMFVITFSHDCVSC